MRSWVRVRFDGAKARDKMRLGGGGLGNIADKSHLLPSLAQCVLVWMRQKVSTGHRVSANAFVCYLSCIILMKIALATEPKRVQFFFMHVLLCICGLLLCRAGALCLLSGLRSEMSQR